LTGEHTELPRKTRAFRLALIDADDSRVVFAFPVEIPAESMQAIHEAVKEYLPAILAAAAVQRSVSDLAGVVNANRTKRSGRR
jgi:hypothetical protein